jgi:hypothetical protein
MTIRPVNAQLIFPVKYRNQADIKVFVETQKSRADLNVSKVKFPQSAIGNKGWWFFTNKPSRGSKKIFFVAIPSQADLKIFFVDYPSQAGWNRRQKQYLLD